MAAVRCERAFVTMWPTSIARTGRANLISYDTERASTVERCVCLGSLADGFSMHTTKVPKSNCLCAAIRLDNRHASSGLGRAMASLYPGWQMLKVTEWFHGSRVASACASPGARD